MERKDQIRRYLKNNWVPSCLVLFTLSNLYLLSPILGEGFLYGDDNTSNFAYTVRISEMISAGNFRFWFGDYSMGQALFFYYQPLPHLCTALIYLAFPFADPVFLYKLIVLLLIVLLPFTMYQGMRWMGFTKVMCLLAALICYSVSSWRGFGFELNTLFRWGQYSHLWGLVLTPIAVGYAYKSFFGERKLFLPVTLLGVLFLTHTVMGIVACLAIASLFLISEWKLTQKRNDAIYLAKIFIGVFCIAAVILVPNLLYEDYVDGFSTVDQEKHFGIGLSAAFTKFFKGEIFDQNNFPVLTVCIVLALWIGGFCYLKNKSAIAVVTERRLLLFLGLNFILSIVLISGAQTFPFLKYTPVYNSVLVLRLLPLWHFIAILTVSFGLGKFIAYAGQSSRTAIPEIQFLKYTAQVVILVLVVYLGYRQQDLFTKKAKVYNLIGAASNRNPGYKEALSFLKTQAHGRLHMAGVKSHFESHLPALLADKPASKFFAASSHTNLGLFYLKHMKDTLSCHYNLFGLPYLLDKTKQDRKGIGTSIFKNRQYEIYQTTAQNSYFDITHANTVCFSHNQAARTLVLNWMHTPELLDHKEHIVIAEDRPRSYFEAKGFTKFIELEQEDKRVAAKAFTLENTKTQEKIESHVGEAVGKYLSQELDTTASSSYGQVLAAQMEDGYYQATLKVSPNEKDSLLWATLKVNAHPDWIAKVDGEVVDWVQMSPCFMAVPISAGTHVVEFEFGISPLRKALLGLSLLTIIGLWGMEVLQAERVRNFEVVGGA